MKIEVWDYDAVFADELIGYTTIDLEDRYFNQEWKEMKYKPIEIRTLRHPDYATVQGSVYLWLEVFEKKDKIDMEPWMITPEPETEIETWQCTKINNGRATFRLVGYIDSGKGYKITNDLYKRKVYFRIFEDNWTDSE